MFGTKYVVTCAAKNLKIGYQIKHLCAKVFLNWDFLWGKKKRMLWNTYLRSKLLNQFNGFVRVQRLRSWIIFPAHAKSLFKFDFGHKSFILYPIFKIFAAHFTTNSMLKIGKKMFCLFIHFLTKDNPWKCILRAMFQNNSLFKLSSRMSPLASYKK